MIYRGKGERLDEASFEKALSWKFFPDTCFYNWDLLEFLYSVFSFCSYQRKSIGVNQVPIFFSPNGVVFLVLALTLFSVLWIDRLKF